MSNPGCFASASVFSADSEHCKKCSAFEACAVESRETLKRIKASVNVDEVLQRHVLAIADRAKQVKKKKEDFIKSVTEQCEAFICEEDEQIILNITNPKSANFAKLLCGAKCIGKDATEQFANGINPLSGRKKPAFMFVVIDELLAGQKTRADLRQALMDRLNWAASSATPHVSMALGILNAFGHVEISGDNIKIKGASA